MHSATTTVVVLALFVAIGSHGMPLVGFRSEETRVLEVGSSAACNASLKSALGFLEKALDSLGRAEKKCSSTVNLIESCLQCLDGIMYDMANTTNAFAAAVPSCAKNGTESPKQRICHATLVNATKELDVDAALLPKTIESCVEFPNGYECKSGIVALLVVAIKWAGLSPKILADCLL